MKIVTSLLLLISFPLFGQEDLITIKKTSDFDLTGDGSSMEWREAEWIKLTQRKSEGKRYDTQVKLLYSQSGIYTLFRCEDDSIVSTLREDFADLWTEDVVEIFYWPDQSLPVYFEYELSPHNYELPILVPNRDGYFLGWKPWKYTDDRLTRYETSISSKSGDATWTAEFFIPFALMSPLVEGVPAKGTEWRVNMYRLDYDAGVSAWSWQPVRTNFHDYESYGRMVFD